MKVTDEMIEIGYRASLFASKGEVRKILTAALSALPAGVKPLDGEEYRRVMDAAIAAYEANTPPTYRYSATALCKAVEAAFAARILSALSPAGVETPAPSPAPSTHVMPTTSAWQWWAGSDEEWCTVGPEDTREAIIQAATSDSLGEFQNEEGGWNLGFYIVEARQDPLRLADWIEADRLLERAEEGMADSDRVSSEYDDGPWFECTPEQEKDLEERVKRVCDEWQAEHRLVFSCATFSHTRNREHVIVELPDDRATTEGKDNG